MAGTAATHEHKWEIEGTAGEYWEQCDCGETRPYPNPDPAEQAAPPRPLHYVLDKSEKFGSAWFHVMGPNGFITQTDSREWADKEAERLNFANGIELAAPAAIEQARPQTPERVEDLRPIAGEILRQMDNAGWIQEHVKRDWEDMKTWLAERLAPGLVAVRVYPAAAAEPALERTPPQRVSQLLEELRGCSMSSSAQVKLAEIRELLAVPEPAAQHEPAPTPSRWIPVSEKLPEKQVYVNVVVKYANEVRNVSVAFLDSLGRWNSEFEITHWQPLPAWAEASSLGAKENETTKE